MKWDMKSGASNRTKRKKRRKIYRPCRSKESFVNQILKIMSNTKNILVPVNFSKESRAGIATAVNLANKSNATLHLLHIIDEPIAENVATGGDAVRIIRQKGEHQRYLSELLRKSTLDLDTIEEEYNLHGIETVKKVDIGDFVELTEKYIQDSNITIIFGFRSKTLSIDQ